VYYSAGVASVTTFSAAVVLPQEGVLWLVARLMLDTAGGLFGLYLVTAMVLSLAGRVMRLRGRPALPDPRPQK
jgi:hypothetical protein